MPDIYEDDPDFDNDGVNSLRKGVRARGDQVARSGLVTASGVVLLLGVLAVIWTAHVNGRIHQITTTQAPEGAAAQPIRPGGQDIIRLERLERMGTMVPEFTSATLLPGNGMMMLQANLDLPGRGDVPLLTGTKESDIHVNQSISGAAFSASVEHRDGNHWSVPVELLAGQASTKQSSEVVPDGSRATAHYDAATQSGIDLTVQMTLAGRALDVMMTAKNTSNAARALTLSWQPQFAAAQGLEAMTLQPPAQEGSAAGVASESITLGARQIDQMFSPLKHSYLGGGPQVRLHNNADGYTLLLTAMTPSIRGLHVKTSQADRTVLLAFSTAGSERPDDARTVVQPGETLQWHVRIEAVANANYTPSAP